ncbi:MAG: phycobilisome rod-core linker polypeptide [Synechococcus sp.]
MPLPRLDYPLTSQNQRVGDLGGLEAPLDQTVIAAAANGENWTSLTNQIESAYRQVFFHAMKADRDPFLESQLRNGSITMRDFIRGLLLSRRFTEGYVSCNSNYRLVDQVVGRILGRPVHGDGERLSWSIVIGNLGFAGFVDAVLDSSEYMDSFGYDQVPNQRSRVIPGAATGEMPIYQRFPRYGSDWRDMQWTQKLQTRDMAGGSVTPAWIKEPPAWVKKFWLGLALVGSVEVLRVLIIVAGSMLSTR